MKTNELKQISAVARLFKENKNIPILNTILLDNGNICFTNLEIFIIWENFIDRKLCGCIEKKPFLSALESIDNYSADQNGKTLLIFNDKKTFSCPLLNKDEFPEIPSDEFEKIGTFTDNDITKILTASKFVSLEEMRPVMQHIYVKNHIVGTNGHILYFKESDIKSESELLINPKTIKLMKIFDMPFEVEKGKKFLLLKNKDIKIIQRFPEANFPQWEDVMPDKLENKFTLPVNFKKELPTFSKFSGQPRRIIFKSTGEICTKNIDEGTTYVFNTEDKPETWEDAGFNLDYLTLILSFIEGQITIQQHEPLNAHLINGCFLLMPVRL